MPKNGLAERITISLCPKCAEEKRWIEMKIPALVFEEKGKMWIIKKCKKHGEVRDLYWGDAQSYKKIKKYHDPGISIENPFIKIDKINCPLNCGLCKEHKSHTCLGNIAITNRCDLSCWYCFYYAKENDPIYEPTLEEIKLMARNMANEKPVGTNAIQITGGEPTLRDDLIEIIGAVKREGIEHIQLNTNGITISKNPQLLKNICKAGSHVMYLSFDGISPETNPKNFWEVPDVIKNCRQTEMGIVLVPTVIGGINDHELGDIVRFAFGHIDVVRGVNFQPVSLVGRMPDKLRKQQRITIPGAIKRIEEQTDGQIGKEDFYTIPCTKAVTDFIEVMKNSRKYRMSTHFACGMATYVFKDGKKLVPITRFFNVDDFFSDLETMTENIKNARSRKIEKTIAVSRLLLSINKYVDESKKPKDLKFGKLLLSAFTSGNYKGLAPLHHKSLFIGLMHFQDPYNWDIDRTHKCVIHYGSPDGRIIPFCTFNVIPELYRDTLQRKHSMAMKEWEKKTGKKMSETQHQRNLTEKQKKEIIKYYAPYKLSKKRIMEPDWEK
ncbi:MAG: radical SAM protein [Candidatus Aenigmarchaeota archaeon]|nr:radical SAM protein [Candidatus Aenigmarchaeota archaeon]